MSIKIGEVRGGWGIPSPLKKICSSNEDGESFEQNLKTLEKKIIDQKYNYPLRDSDFSLKLIILKELRTFSGTWNISAATCVTHR